MCEVMSSNQKIRALHMKLNYHTMTCTKYNKNRLEQVCM